MLNGEDPAEFSKVEAMSLAEIDNSGGAEITSITFKKSKVTNMTFRSSVGIVIKYDGKTFSAGED